MKKIVFSLEHSNTNKERSAPPLWKLSVPVSAPSVYSDACEASPTLLPRVPDVPALNTAPSWLVCPSYSQQVMDEPATAPAVPTGTRYSHSPGSSSLSSSDWLWSRVSPILPRRSDGTLNSIENREKCCASELVSALSASLSWRRLSMKRCIRTGG